MNNGRLLLWTFTLATSLWALVILETVSKNLAVKSKLRDVTGEEFPEGLYGFFRSGASTRAASSWSAKTSARA